MLPTQFTKKIKNCSSLTEILSTHEKGEIQELKVDLPKCPFGFDTFSRFFKIKNDQKIDVIKKIPLKKTRSLISNTQSAFLNKKTNSTAILKKENKVSSKKTEESLVHTIGFEKLKIITHKFFTRIQIHPEFNGFFMDKNLERINEAKCRFLLKNLSNFNPKADFTSSFLKSIHTNLTISNEKYDLFKGIYAIVLRENGIGEEIIVEILLFFEKVRKTIVSYEKSPMEKLLLALPSGTNDLLNMFYERLLSNSILKTLFKNWSVERHHYHFQCVVEFLAKDIKLDLINLRKNHKDSWINDDVFFHFQDTLSDSLRRLNVNEEDIFSIVGKLNGVRIDVCGGETPYDIILKKNDLSLVVETFYENLKNNNRLAKLFEGKNKTKIKTHCEKMVNFCLQGPSEYRACDVTPAHLKAGVEKEDFLEMRAVLEKTLSLFLKDKNEINYILIDLDYYQYDIYNGKCILERIGGEKNVEYLVKNFYLKAFNHENLSKFYKNIDINDMIKNQNFMFRKLFSAKQMKSYNFKNLRTIHLNIHLTDEDFKFFCSSMATMVGELLDNFDIAYELKEFLYKSRRDILNIAPEIE